ncbi:MAG: carbohydrate-binding protein [Armatimonadota bacterium]
MMRFNRNSPIHGWCWLLLICLAFAVPAWAEGPLTAVQLAEIATVTGGDLLLFTPPEGMLNDVKGPLLSFAPLQASDELIIPITVPADDYYEITMRNLFNPRFTAYLLVVDGVYERDGVWLAMGPLQMRDRRWMRVHLTPGAHQLRFRKRKDYPVHPLVIESISLQAGSTRSYYLEAEKLPTVGCDPAPFRPALGGVNFSGLGEFRFPATGAGQTVTLELPPAPARATHLIAALVGGPDRGITELQLDGTTTSTVSTFTTTNGMVSVVAVLPIAQPSTTPRRLTVKCTGKDATSSGFTLGIDGVAYGEDYTFEAEWLAWNGPWAAGKVPYSTNSGRASDRGYAALDCRDAAQPAETTLDLPWTGTFRLEVRMARNPDQGKCQFQFDNTLFTPVLDLYDQRASWPAEWVTLGEITLTPGKHTLRIWCRDQDAARRRIRLDAIRLVPEQ